MPVIEPDVVETNPNSKSRGVVVRHIIADFIGEGRKIVETAGISEPLVDSPTECKRVIIMALPENTGEIVVGGSTVVANPSERRGLVLFPAQSVLFEINDLSKIYIDSTVNGEGVVYVYFN